MATCAIALGGNIGDSASLFQHALQLLNSDCIRVSAVSPLYKSSAMGSAAGDDFVNAAAILETELNPLQLLKRLHGVEDHLGRTRKTHWGPRPIDLDLLLFEQQVIDTAALVVPHPAMWHRRFVLEPLVQIAPDFVHPVLHQSVRQLFHRLQQRPLPIGVSHAAASQVSIAEIRLHLNNRFGPQTVHLAADATKDDAWFAYVDLEASGDAPDKSRTQPAQQPDRTLVISANHQVAEETLRQAIVDLCAGALG